ncbi:MAG: hypothetical protein ACWIPJ_10390 [Polaribacter sp.]
MFATICFDEKLTKYGYEDLVFSKTLQKKNNKIIHLENEVSHLKIDTNTVFLKKTKNGIENLVKLIKTNQLDEKDVSILKIYKKMELIKLPFLLHIIFPTLEKLAKNTSSLLFYNLFRIGYLHQIIKNSQ